MTYSRTLMILLLSGIACASSTQRGASNQLETARSELDQANQQLALRAGSEGFVAAMTEAIAPTGIYGAAVRELGAGPAATRAFLLRDSLNATSRATWRVVRSDVSADGRDGYSYGYLDVIRANGDTQPGIFKSYWRKQPTGAWKILALGRGRRELAKSPLPAQGLQPPAREYRAWRMRDTTEGWGLLKATEIAFSDSSATNQRAAFMSFAAPDAGKLQGTHFVFGPDAIGEEFRSPPPGLAGIQWHAEWGTVALSNDLGFNVGPVTSRGNASQPGGLFLTVWRRQPNGEWKYVVD